MYKKAGYDGLVITDHYTGDYFEALRVRSWKDKINEFFARIPDCATGRPEAWH
jgi:hypothetical protein